MSAEMSGIKDKEWKVLGKILRYLSTSMWVAVAADYYERGLSLPLDYGALKNKRVTRDTMLNTKWTLSKWLLHE